MGNYEMFFRGYDPALARMMQVDAMAEKFSSLTPYNYAFNNPALLNDPLSDAPRKWYRDPYMHDAGYAHTRHNGQYVRGRDFSMFYGRAADWMTGRAQAEMWAEAQFNAQMLQDKKNLSEAEYVSKYGMKAELWYLVTMSHGHEVVVGHKIKTTGTRETVARGNRGGWPDCPPGMRCELRAGKVYIYDGTTGELMHTRSLREEAQAKALETMGEASKDAVIAAATGEGVGWAVGRAIGWAINAYRAYRAAQMISATSRYLKLFEKINEYDATITLYRGTTGSEAGASTLFLTDDAAVAATYVKNGGQVMQYQITRFSLQALEQAGVLTLRRGIHGAQGAVSTEYVFQGVDLIKALNYIAKPF